MDRRKTILIAVLVNAGLLVLLFIAFLYQEEEVPVRQGLVQQQMEESRPLFNDAALVAAVPEPVTSAPLQVEHLLPPIAAVEEPVAPQPPALSPLAAVAAAIEVQVKKGDTLEKIAKSHHTTVDEIIQFNQLPSSFLRVGQVLKLPPERAASHAVPKIAAAEKKAVGHEYYTVKVGDNPWTIAMKHHMKVEELLKLNNLNEEKARRLKVGDKLRIQ